jgi:REP element-mobilizing transposase RayT
VHITLRAAPGLTRLRGRKVWNVVRSVCRALLGRRDFRVCELTLLNNHLHLVVEAQGREALAAGMHSLCTRLAKNLNLALLRKGKFFGDRYHARVLKTPLEVKRALLYILNNFRRHAAQAGKSLAPDFLDPYSTARLFTGWSSRGPSPPTDSPWVSAANTWLLSRGWRKHGRLAVESVPGT